MLFYTFDVFNLYSKREIKSYIPSPTFHEIYHEARTCTILFYDLHLSFFYISILIFFLLENIIFIKIKYLIISYFSVYR